MKYSAEVEINLPLQEVVRLFDNPENLKYWQPELVSFEPLRGTPGHPGAKSKLKYKKGGKELEMTEIITKRNLPDEFSGTYKVKGVLNLVNNRFIPVSTTRTKYISEQEFRFKGIMKMMGLIPGTFKRQTNKYLQQFKEFAEKQNEAHG